jgi:triosephosphate isomerase
MSKEKIVIGNWKMQLGLGKSLHLAKDLAKSFGKYPGSVVVCPDYASLELVSEIIKKSSLQLGAQNVAMQNHGALTGEVSVANLKELGVRYVIIGHSERRQLLGETDEMINLKLKTVLAAKYITPILCIGEKTRGKSPAVVFKKQLTVALKGVKLGAGQSIIVAYEPLWAIGTGKVINVKEIMAAQAAINQLLEKLYSKAIVKNNFRIIYGGSVNAQNAKTFSGLENVSGLLVGGASLKTSEFKKICSDFLT